MTGFTVLGTAHKNTDGVVDAGTKDYAIVVSVNPEPVFPVYAIRNKTTLVDEYLAVSLAKCRWMMVEMQKDLDEGYDRHGDNLDAITSFTNALTKKSGGNPPPSGKAN